MPGECPPAAPSASQAPPWSPVSEMPVSGNVAPDNPDLTRFGLSPAARKHELPVRQVDGGESSPIRAFGAQVQPVIVIGHARKVTNAIELRLQPQLDTQSPWGVAPATPRTNRCLCSAAAQSSPSS